MTPAKEHKDGVNPDILGLLAKIADLQNSVGTLRKDKENPGKKYKYLSSERVLESIREHMKRLNLITLTSARLGPVSTYTSRNGIAFERVIVEMTTTVIDADTGATLKIDSVGEGADDGDKAAMKGATAATKYGLIALARIASGDEPEADGKVDQDVDDVPLPVARKKDPSVYGADGKEARQQMQANLQEKALAGGNWSGSIRDVNGQAKLMVGGPIGDGRYVARVTPLAPYDPPKPTKSGKQTPYRFRTAQGATFFTFEEENAAIQTFIDAMVEPSRDVNVIYEPSKNPKYPENKLIAASIHGEVAE